MEQQVMPNEILSKIQNYADYETARNMGKSNAHLKANLNGVSGKDVETLLSMFLIFICIMVSILF